MFLKVEMAKPQETGSFGPILPRWHPKEHRFHQSPIIRHAMVVGRPSPQWVSCRQRKFFCFSAQCYVRSISQHGISLPEVVGGSPRGSLPIPAEEQLVLLTTGKDEWRFPRFCTQIVFAYAHTVLAHNVLCVRVAIGIAQRLSFKGLAQFWTMVKIIFRLELLFLALSLYTPFSV
jgi:hypothetical protein